MEAELMIKVGEKVDKGEKVALVTITENDGSSPGRKGNMMAVFQDGSIFGTVGGGNLEYTIIKEAKIAMSENESKELEYSLSDAAELGMKCGGTVKAFIKVFKKKDKIIIVGGGHIGAAIYRVAHFTDFLPVIFDDREEFCNVEKFPEAHELFSGNIGENLREYSLDENSYVIIVSRGHKCDKEALREVIKKNPKYIGLIGSSKKIIDTFKDLIEEGLDRKLFEKVHAPMGLDVADDYPREIAISIMAEILKIKNNKTGLPMRDVKKIVY
ncbi:MAG: XdhC family protein [Fusobacteriaceae bacterium]